MKAYVLEACKDELRLIARSKKAATKFGKLWYPAYKFKKVISPASQRKKEIGMYSFVKNEGANKNERNT